MLIMGIDPGSSHLGIGLVQKRGNRFQLIHAETVSSNTRDTFFERLAQILQRIEAILRDHAPNVVAIESTFFGKNAHSAFQLGTARGVAIAACLAKGLCIYEYAPAQVKSVVTGYGRSDKLAVRKMLEISLGQKLELGFDATDAIAIAICHGSSVNWRGQC